MQYLVNEEEMKRYDTNTIEGLGIPALVLMERAALGAAEEIGRRFPKSARVLIVAGTGNNGGDGLAAGRILQEMGYEVDYVLLGKRESLSEAAGVQLSILEKSGQTVMSVLPEAAYDMVVDALFGIGLSRNLEGIYAEAVAWINKSRAFVISLDIPSGIDAGTGAVMGTAVSASLTVTFGFYKRGCFVYPGALYAGQVVCWKIGITSASFQGRPPRAAFLEKEDVPALLPPRRPDGNKGTFGHVLVIAGSKNMCGACLLCAESAYRMGAGLVRVWTVEENREILQTALPEAVLDTYPADAPLEEGLADALSWADCVVMGPGMGMSAWAFRLAGYVFQNCDKPLVADADALNLLAGHLEWLENPKRRGRTVLTPHLGEFSRLSGTGIAQCRQQLFTLPREWAKRYDICVVCKDARTMVCAKEGLLFLNVSGNDGMATAGAGDVLSGIIGGLLGQGLPPLEGAALGVYLHGAAGDWAREEKGGYGMLARDIVEGLSTVTG